MTEVELDFVKIQPRKGGTFMVTIPRDVVKELGIKDNERVKVLIDRDKRRIIYQL